MTYATTYTLQYGRNQTSRQKYAEITITEPTTDTKTAITHVIASHENISPTRVVVVRWEEIK